MKKKKTALQIAYAKMKFTIDPSLNELSGKSLFPKKLALANEMLSKMKNVSELTSGKY